MLCPESMTPLKTNQFIVAAYFEIFAHNRRTMQKHDISHKT